MWHVTAQNPNEMERSSRKHRDSDRGRDKDSTKEYKHRSSKHSDDHHRSKHDKHRETDREGSKDRELREKSVDNRRQHKRRDRGDSEDEDRYNEVRDKRIRVSDERKERRRFEVKVAAAEDERDREERKERRRFEDRVKKEEMDFGDNDGDKLHQRNLNGETIKMEPNDELLGVSSANGGGPGMRSKAFGTPHDAPLIPSHPPPKIGILQMLARVAASLSMPYPRLKQLY
ncbi:hypothetical protein L1987_68518 [Smallanthus sonchifolius]|uniref:Uncharacterized protein n=1 Tax=Smallanthus sonchifolius TaxID=185202 RepID=A0ACB9B4W8_9ASTR|nr:hypothetical protein L1987_68518 [Smallanthus sonchifolius]